MYALDSRTGLKLWNFTTDHKVDSSPTVVEGTMYVGCDYNNVYVLDGRTGNYTAGHVVVAGSLGTFICLLLVALLGPLSSASPATDLASMVSLTAGIRNKHVSWTNATPACSWGWNYVQ